MRIPAAGKLRRRSAPSVGQDDPTAVEQVDETSEGGFEWPTATSAAVTRVMDVALLGCVVAGVVALIGVMVLATRSPVVVSSPDEPVGLDGWVESPAVSAFAEDFVVTWLSASAEGVEQLDRFVASTQGVTLPAEGWQVRDVTTAGFEATDVDGVWSVTVAVGVAESAKGPWSRRYFAVPVLHEGGSLVALSLPAPVPAPRLGRPEPVLASHRLTSSSPLVTAVSDFLASYLVGGSDLSRFVSPDASIAPVLPYPFESVEVAVVAADQQLSAAQAEDPDSGHEVGVLVRAAGHSSPEARISVEYALTLRAREGRWEVASIDPAPATRARTTSAESNQSKGN